MYLGLPPKQKAEELYDGIPQAKNLNDYFGQLPTEINLSTFAHLIIDPQRYYADPEFKPARGTQHTKEISEEIARVAPLFREASIQTAVVYFDWNLSEDFNNAMGGLYLLDAGPDYGDLMIPKNKSDGFVSSRLHETLEDRGIENLFISGFNATACVSETVFGALRDKYQVALLEDCIGQNKNYEDDIPRYMSLMMKQGAQRTNSEEALNFISQLG